MTWDLVQLIVWSLTSAVALLQSDLAAHLISCQTLCLSSRSLSGFLQLTVTISFVVLQM